MNRKLIRPESIGQAHRVIFQMQKQLADTEDAHWSDVNDLKARVKELETLNSKYIKYGKEASIITKLQARVDKSAVDALVWAAEVDQLQERVKELEVSLAEYVYCPDTQKMIEYESMRDKAIKLLPEPPE